MFEKHPTTNQQNKATAHKKKVLIVLQIQKAKATP
jgi:hypothetical protein